jgi:hypothetical protein
MRDYMKLMEDFVTGEQETKWDFWDFARHLGLDEFKEKFDDATINWHNRNTRTPIDRMVKNKKAKLLSMLRLWFKKDGPQMYSTPFATMDDFKQAANAPVTMWRGGGGEYNPDYPGHHWVSFTLSERRVTTFSEYDGTRATRSYMLPKRRQYWVVELTIPLSEILLYLPNGGDEEVIVSAETAKKAKVIKQVTVDA